MLCYCGRTSVSIHCCVSEFAADVSSSSVILRKLGKSFSSERTVLDHGCSERLIPAALRCQPHVPLQVQPDAPTRFRHSADAKLHQPLPVAVARQFAQRFSRFGRRSYRKTQIIEVRAARFTEPQRRAQQVRNGRSCVHLRHQFRTGSNLEIRVLLVSGSTRGCRAARPGNFGDRLPVLTDDGLALLRTLDGFLFHNLDRIRIGLALLIQDGRDDNS